MRAGKEGQEKETEMGWWSEVVMEVRMSEWRWGSVRAGMEMSDRSIRDWVSW